MRGDKEQFCDGFGDCMGECPTGALKIEEKLDDTEGYARKLGAILSEPTIPKVTVVRVEVPCGGGLTAITREAIRLSGRTDLAAEEVTISLGGDVTQRADIK